MNATHAVVEILEGTIEVDHKVLRILLLAGMIM
jgi:hypothetical protein